MIIKAGQIRVGMQIRDFEYREDGSIRMLDCEPRAVEHATLGCANHIHINHDECYHANAEVIVR